jgi:hypothetical protein
MPVGPDFISLQVRDLDTAAFYEERLGLRRAPASPPGSRSISHRRCTTSSSHKGSRS